MLVLLLLILISTDHTCCTADLDYLTLDYSTLDYFTSSWSLPARTIPADGNLRLLLLLLVLLLLILTSTDHTCCTADLDYFTLDYSTLDYSTIDYFTSSWFPPAPTTPVAASLDFLTTGLMDYWTEDLVPTSIEHI